MTTWNFNEDIPAADNNPSEDQPLMLENNASIDGILDEDHYTFETTISGKSVDGLHKQVTFPFQQVPGAQTDPESTLYTDANAESASLNSNLWYRNNDGIFPTSAIRAAVTCGVTNGTVGDVPRTNSFNVTNVATNSGIVTVTLAAGAIKSNDAIVLGTYSTGSAIGGSTGLQPVTITGSNTISFGGATSSKKLFLLVIQI
jgi:hypothetical protein